jgi:signal transduction histidine kinase
MASPSGIPQLGDLAHGAHVGQLYRDAQDLLEMLVPFFATGLVAYERCIWVTAQPLGAAEARAALARRIPDLADREATGQIEIVDHDAWYLRSGDLTPQQVIDRWLDAEEQALATGYTGLRISGNTAWLRPDQWDAFVDYEARVHAAFQGRKIVALCSYSLGRCHAHEVVDVVRNHSMSLVRAGDDWELVRGATAALSALETQTNAPADAQAQPLGHNVLVRLDLLTAALGEVTTKLQLVDVLVNVVAPALDVDGLLILEQHDHMTDATLVGHGSGVEALRHVAAFAASRTLWSSDPAAVGATASNLRAVAVLPLATAAARLGTCVLGFTVARELPATYRALAQDVARQIALALDRSITYERLDHERERAELASRAKDEFLAMLGHELRNPLSPILTATQLMRLRGGDVHEKERVVIERQCKHMMRLVDDLLDVSRITRGKVELRRRAVEIGEIVSQAVELASPALEERQHKLSLDVPQTGVVVHVDPQRLAQVLCNLLTNAAKYTPACGSVHLAVQPSNSTVAISVQDNGIGIDSKLLPHIFDLFVQGRQGIDRRSGGLGLGLAIARSLLEMHGGLIRAHSDGLNLGSTFTIELPRFANTRPSSGRTNSSGAFALATSRRRRVLVVDDNEDAAFLFSEALKRLGHHVEVAYDGPSALEAVRDNPPEIAFLDIGLPVMDGYELGRRLRELGGKPPHLIAVTGYGHTSDRERSREAGFDMHLVKPIELAQVQDAIAKLD